MTKSFTKKIAVTILFIFAFSLPINIVFAAEIEEKIDVDDLIYQSNVIEKNPYENQIKTFKDLPDIRLEQGVGIAIKTVLRWSFYLTLISLIVTAIYYILAMGKEEDLTKARQIILYLVIGMAIIASAYGIISGVSKFNFFN